MKKLIIITGMSGSGKTTLAKYIQTKIEEKNKVPTIKNDKKPIKENRKHKMHKEMAVTIITLDTIFETICDTIGFRDRKGKQRNCTIAKNCVKGMIQECMRREDEIIIVDYPFQTSWEYFFTKISKQYEYEVLTVKLYGETFEKQWERTCQRDLSEQRHVMHESPSYNPKNKEILIRNKQSKEELKQIYESESKTKILVGKELKVINKDENSIEEAFRKIEKWIIK